MKFSQVRAWTASTPEHATQAACAKSRTPGLSFRCTIVGLTDLRLGRLFGISLPSPGDSRTVTPYYRFERLGYRSSEGRKESFIGIKCLRLISPHIAQRYRYRDVTPRDGSDELVGFVHFLFHEDTWSTASACYLQDLYVDPRVRGTGCGRKLIEAVGEAAKAAGANSPYWLTHETNAVARQLYDRLGQNQGFIQYTYVPGTNPSRPA
jgi:GNAT superfamily N-acetyltransferase